MIGDIVAGAGNGYQSTKEGEKMPFITAEEMLKKSG